MPQKLSYIFPWQHWMRTSSKEGVGQDNSKLISSWGEGGITGKIPRPIWPASGRGRTDTIFHLYHLLGTPFLSSLKPFSSLSAQIERSVASVPTGFPATHSKWRPAGRLTPLRETRDRLPWTCARIPWLLRITWCKGKSNFTVWPQLSYQRWFYPSYCYRTTEQPKCIPREVRIISRSRYEKQQRNHFVNWII